jgi:hypothetical protein
MTIKVIRNGSQYLAVIYLNNVSVWHMAKPNREDATLEAWNNALLIKEVISITQQSVYALRPNYV